MRIEFMRTGLLAYLLNEKNVRKDRRDTLPRDVAAPRATSAVPLKAGLRA